MPSQWIEKVIGWLSRVFLQESAGASLPSSPLKRWRCHVQRFFYRLYASMRIEELFSIIRGESGSLSTRSRATPPKSPALGAHPHPLSPALVSAQISRSRSLQWKT